MIVIGKIVILKTTLESLMIVLLAMLINGICQMRWASKRSQIKYESFIVFNFS